MKAQQEPEYQDYLARKGEDNSLHYSVKLEAAELLMANTANTFVTPVFNGSASLRDAAGQLIEEVTKAIRRKKTVDEAFMSNLYDQVNSLYRLDQIAPQQPAEEEGEAAERDMGPLPGTAVTLLASLAVAWVLIALYWARGLIHEKRKG